VLGNSAELERFVFSLCTAPLMGEAAQ